MLRCKKWLLGYWANPVNAYLIAKTDRILHRDILRRTEETSVCDILFAKTDDAKGNTNNNIQLITTQKTVIQPFMSTMIDVKASGPALDAFRPNLTLNVMMEGNPDICNRLSVEVLPGINALQYQNCKQKVKVHNLSQYPKTIAKGVKLALCSTEFEQCDMLSDININLMTNVQPVETI